MKKYYVYYPRNFSNEFTIYFVDSKEGEKRINDAIERIDWAHASMYKITYKDVLAYQQREREWLKWGKQCGKQWAGIQEPKRYE